MGNQLRTLDKEVLEPLASLEILLLDSNQLEDINGNFDNDYHNNGSTMLSHCQCFLSTL